MTAAEHESIAIGPCRSRGVVFHDAGKQRVRKRCESHGRAGMTRVRSLWGIHCEATYDVDGSLFQISITHGGNLSGGRCRRRAVEQLKQNSDVLAELIRARVAGE